MLIEHTSLPKAPPFVRPTIVGAATAPKGKNHIAQGQKRLATPQDLSPGAEWVVQMHPSRAYSMRERLLPIPLVTTRVRIRKT